jgi:hypothetical protein
VPFGSTRRQFSEAKRRVGITASAVPQPTRRAENVETASRQAPVEVGRSAEGPHSSQQRPGRRSGLRRRRSSASLDDLSSLAEQFQAIVAERDRARAAIQEIRRIVKALR